MKKNNKEKITLNSEKVKKREQRIKILKITILLILLFLIILYFILRVIYDLGDFTVSLDPQLADKSGLVMYEHLADKQEKKILKAEKLEYMDNICVQWLPDNISDGEGSHNGANYLAYSFYLENQGVEPINYWYKIVSDDVIKNVDKAIRIMVIRNDEKIVYAKPNERTGEAEGGESEPTEKFYSNTELVLKQRASMQPGDIDKFTIVIFLEGDDPDCTDELIGGEMKMHMEITEEHTNEDQNNIEETQV